MALDRVTPRTRRAILVASLSGLVASALSAVGRPVAVQAVDGEPVTVGGSLSGITQTVLTNTATDGSAFAGIASGLGTGLFGSSPAGTGVHGSSAASAGVFGFNNSATFPAVVGQSLAGNTGVQGYSGSAALPVSPTKAGVHGYAAQDATAVGVKGESTVGTGVVAASSTGTALRVAGKAQFSRSGKASVAPSATYVDVTVPGGLTSHSVAHATIQMYRSGTSIAAVRPNWPSAGKIRIYLTKVGSTTASTAVGWFVAEY